MLKLEYIDTPGNILREDLTKIITRPEEVKLYFSEMMKLCRTHRGVGLAANQVGLRHNFFFVAPSVNLTGKAKVGHLCVNPYWEPVDADGARIEKGEGCLSLPDRKYDVHRWNVIQAVWYNTVGHRLQRKLRGLAAHVFQHEHDHLRGVTLEQSGVRSKVS
jgi:peptide deformylase